MITGEMIKKYTFFITFFLLFFVTSIMLNIEKNRVLGVKIINKEDIQNMFYEDSLNPTILFNGEKAAIDYKTNIIYISQNIKHNTKKEEMRGILSTQEKDISLYFIEDELYNNLSEAVKNNYKFLMIAKKGSVYKTYQVVYTMLPVVVLDGTYIGKNENEKDSWEGELWCFDAYNEEFDSYSVIQSHVEWHVRGDTSATLEKKPFKISLKDNNYEKHNLSLCDMGADDDWILNPMNLDDLKVREKVMMDLWSVIKNFTNYNLDMSVGEYVEVVIEGEYRGLYLLQRRIDAKYLKQDNAALIKFENYDTGNTSSFEVEFDLLTIDGYEIEKEIVSGEYIHYMDLHNFIDTSILVQISAAHDNFYKNRFLLVSTDENGNLLSKLILWDTDMSFGVYWNNGFDYHLKKSLNAEINQFEFQKMLVEYPNLESLIAKRYFELRENILSEQVIFEILENNYNRLKESSARVRDIEEYGLYYSGKDTYENINLFIKERLKYLDSYYNSFL